MHQDEDAGADAGDPDSDAESDEVAGMEGWNLVKPSLDQLQAEDNDDAKALIARKGLGNWRSPVFSDLGHEK